MALFGKSTADALLKRLQDGTQPPKNVGDILESLRFAEDFSLERTPWLFTHVSKEVRRFAAEQAAGLVSRPLGDALAKAMIEAPSDVRRELASVIHTVAESRVVAYLTRLMNAKEPKEREAALDLIEVSPNPRTYLGHLKAGLRDPLSKVRQRTVRILGKTPDDPTIALMLHDLLHDEDDTVRHLVIEALAKKPTPDIIEPFFHRLAHESPDTRAVMVRALRQLTKSGSSHKLEKELMPILADEDPQIRELAVKILSELPDQLRVLRSFLSHCSGLAFWLRERSIESIQKVSNDLVPALVQLVDEEDEDVRVGALQMASAVHDPRIFPAMQKHFLSDHDWWERSMSAAAIGNFDSEASTDTLLERLDDPAMRYSVIPALGKQSSSAATGALIDCLRDPNRGVRTITLDALRGHRTPEVIDSVRRCGLSDDDEEVRMHAAETLRSLDVEDAVLLHRIESGGRNDGAEVPEEDDLGLTMANELLNE